MQTSWPVTGGSIIGSAHVRKGLPNQDAYGSKNLGGGIQVLALSDGHGSERHPYSDIGSKAAVEAAIECVEAYVSAYQSIDSSITLEVVSKRQPLDVSKIRYDFEDYVSKDIQVRWLQKIRASSVYEAAIQFGCTLLVAVKFNDLIVFLQLGDGKIAVVFTDGVIYYPIPRDLRYENNETASMAQETAWAEMKVVTMQMETNIHTIVLASDGVENAYPQDYYDDAFFYMELTLGVKNSEKLSEMLARAAHYSKDDTTAVMWHNPENAMQEIKVPESITIWMGDYPNRWLPIASHLEASLSKRIDYAVLLIEAIRRCNGHVTEYLTLKQFYFDRETSQLECMGDGISQPIEMKALYDLISQLLMLPDSPEFVLFGDDIKRQCMASESTASTLRQIKSQLISMKRRLSYDYTTQQFVCDGKSSVVSFAASNGNFPIFFDSDVYLHQLMPLLGDYDSHVGRVIQHPKHKTIWGIINLTQHAWQVVGGKQKSIEPGMTLTLIDGITVFIHGIPVKIRILNQ